MQTVTLRLSRRPQESADAHAPRARTLGRQFRRAVVLLTVVSLSTAALLGIAVLLRGGPMGELESNILLSTLLVGMVSGAVLSYLAPDGGARVVGALGGAIVCVPLVTGLVLIWADLSESEQWLRVFGTGCLLAILASQACLLLAVVGGRRSRQSIIGLIVTLLCSAVAIAMILPAIWIDSFQPGDMYGRTLGAVLILTVAGTVLVPAVLMLSRLRSVSTSTRTDTWVDTRDHHEHLKEHLSADLWAEIEEVAQACGRPVDDVVREAVRRHREQLVAAGHISA